MRREHDRGRREAPQAAPVLSGRSLYITTWDREGSRDRRPTFLAKRRETTTGGVAPGRGVWPRTLADSGAGTAFLAMHGKQSARAAQRRPGAGAPELDLGPQVASPFRVRRGCCRARARGG